MYIRLVRASCGALAKIGAETWQAAAQCAEASLEPPFRNEQLASSPLMHRTNIYLTERQQKRLSAEAKRLGISLAELIRRILDQHLSQSVLTKLGF